MRFRTIIDYTWECDDADSIPSEHIEHLKEAAIERALEMMRDYCCGELSTSIILGQDEVPQETEDGLSYSGWLEIKTEVVE